MAGMLPGVEAARRRRVHQSSGSSSLGIASSHSTSSSSSSRRSSFSLFSPNSYASFSSQPRSRTYQDDDKLGPLAREAKERLDEKLRAQRNPPFTRNNNNDQEMIRNERSTGDVRTQSSSKKIGGKGAKRLIKLGWKSGEQEECAVCLDEFKVGQNLVSLACAHKFHSKCLVPWLHTHAHCPCCRMSIFS